MSKIEKHIEILESIVTDLSYFAAFYDKKKIVREKEMVNIKNAVFMLKGYLDNNNDLAVLLLEFKNGNIYDCNKVVTPKHIVQDVPKFIAFLKSKHIPLAVSADK